MSGDYNEDVVEAARIIRPYLPKLVGPAAEELDRTIADQLMRVKSSPDAVTQLAELLRRDQATSDFVDEVISDPDHLPPDLQRDSYRDQGFQGLPGQPMVLHAGKYVCPKGDFTWYRQAVSAPVPVCPSHQRKLLRA